MGTLSLKGLLWRDGDRHQVMIDAALAAFIVVMGLTAWPVVPLGVPASLAYGAVVAASGVALLWRTRTPLWSMSILAAAMILHTLAIGQVSILAALVCLVAAYTTQAELPAPWRWVFAALLLVGVAWSLITVNPASVQPVLAVRLQVVGISWLVLALFGLLGELRRRNRERLSMAIERAGLLAAQQQSERQLVIVAERSRIAREMHDVLAHSLGVIAVQSEGAKLVFDSDPDRARQALSDIGRLSREAAEEIGGLLDVLRAGDDPQQEWSHRLDEVPSLTASFAGTGLSIELVQDGEFSSVPAQVGAAAYRIIEEALSNVLAHAGRVAVTVAVVVTPHQVRLSIRNDPGVGLRRPTNQGGHGMVGMAQRSKALRGEFQAGPQPDGGWLVEARLPWAT